MSTLRPRRIYSRILITGASSGIGAALAHAYAGIGIRLALTGRDADRLASVAYACRDKGAEVRIATVDVRDRDAMEDWLCALDEDWFLDLVIANAGISGDTSGVIDPARHGDEIIQVNVVGVQNTLEPLIPRLVGRRHGQFGLMSSLAGFRGLPSAPAYCASKAWVKSYGEGLRGRLARNGIGVSVIFPGFVESRITDANTFPMPMRMQAPRAASIIRKGLGLNKAQIAFPRTLYVSHRCFAALPAWVTDPVYRRLPQKE